MAAVPNYSVSPAPPTTPATQGDLWFDTTNQALNVWTTTNVNTGAAGWLPISTPAVATAINASVVSIGPGQFLMVPAVIGSLGVSLPAIPAGHVAICYDVVGQRIYAVGSGGVTTRSVLFA